MTMGHIVKNGPGLLSAYFLCCSLFYPVSAQDPPRLEDIQVSKTELGEDANLTCLASPSAVKLEWKFGNVTIVSSDRIKINTTTIRDQNTMEEYKASTLSILKTTRKDAGNYSCVASYNGANSTTFGSLNLTFPARFSNTTKTRYEVVATRHNNKNNITMECIFDMYYIPDYIEWVHPITTEQEPSVLKNATWVNDRHVKSSHTITAVTFKENGIHTCIAFDKVTAQNVTGNVTLVVYGDPTVELVSALGISRTQIYLNWTVNPANSIVTYCFLTYRKDSELNWVHGPRIDPNATSVVLEKLTPNTSYIVKLVVKTKHADYDSQPSTKGATTLTENPVFVPNISINGFSATSVTIGWQAPPKEIEPYIHYYLLEARKKDGGTPRKAYHSRDSRNLPYMFDNLEPHSTYIFKVRACQDFTKECGNWSEEMEAATLDGVPGKPSDVRVNCSSSLMVLTWGPPEKPNAEIKGYTMELTGTAEYRDRDGKLKKETWGPLSRFNSNDSNSARFDDLQPNTVYTVRLSAMTRTRRRGEEEVRNCSTAPAPPHHPPRSHWRKILDRDRYLFKMHLSKVSERNGPICCYRVYMVRLPQNKEIWSLGQQSSLDVIQYEEAHAVTPQLGAYITDIFSNDNFPADSHIVLGDEYSIFNKSDRALNQPGCERCLKRPERPVTIAPVPVATTTVVTVTTTEEELLEDFTADPVEVKEKEKRSIDDDKDYSNMSMMKDSNVKVEDERDMVKVKDGPLDSSANYTAFIELIPSAINGTLLEPMYSDYLNQLMPAPGLVAPVPSTALEITLQATCAVAALILIIMIIFCIMQTRRSRKLPPHAPLEMSRLPPVFRFLWPTLGRGHGGPAPPPDMPPISQEDLPAAYAQRHADSDYEFQKEFELLQMLSECFPDRTTHASEARENQSKNRYPDIKAYDQTRVKLSQIDSINGSDYINANYVLGYKERKKFICAQGPTDTTVNDFWRMIWEHGLELIVMLTNLEEYSKVKCSKYWPDEVRGSKAFGGITVQHVCEKRYSDYIVRELKISKQLVNAEGQPIVENNGIAKRNGDISKQESSESAPTSPRDNKSANGTESRIVRQYHFLMWKDFAAPEHPYSILKFIKRVNEAWTNMVGRPVVVHCSAGVGRTGTLVALDCLLDQLKSTGQVAVFNTIAELRRQRNFLVQSQKQYVFVYRALVEYAHYGDTEIPASRLKTAIDRLRNTPEGADKCLMEHEFEKMMDSPVAEPLKSCAAGQAEELRSRNRSAETLPYDRNRVILSPIPTREYSTYINASFIEAYDNSEGFIITQDPLPGTIFDFWRMVAEQGVSTVVMLSELGEGKCPRYWDDNTATYEHITVLYEESESCPYYTRRQFRVTNTKTGHSQSVRQLQYQGWPTAPGHVPEVTRGLAELADAVNASRDQLGPMIVHCNLGTERSALFVALCILITQLRTERRVDINAVARKVRSQRAHTIDTFLQYEFLHRAILNYAELHNLLEDS